MVLAVMHEADSTAVKRWLDEHWATLTLLLDVSAGMQEPMGPDPAHLVSLAVEVERPAPPQLTGDLLEDARRVTGLTLDEIGRATRVSGRAVAGWRAGTVPRHREAFLQALRSIGLSLVGGLGAPGVQRWFLSGSPSRLDRLAAGDIEGVAAEARAYETSPAT